MTAEKQAPSFLTARWRYLLMMNYDIDPEILQPYVPAGTELDQWNGRTIVSMVGFFFQDTRLKGLIIPFHRHFDEINLRFYVRRRHGDDVRRGVVFVKEIVPKIAISTIARVVYNEKYVRRTMRSKILVPPGKPQGLVHYEWRYWWKWNGLFAKFDQDKAYLPAPGSEEEFITEHYWGYAAQRDGGTVEYQVEHPQWRVWQALEARFDCNIAQNYAPVFVEALVSSRRHPPLWQRDQR